jgi:hypothetical protein
MYVAYELSTVASGPLLGLMMAMIWTLLEAAIKSSQAAPGYTYKGTNSLTGSEEAGTTEHKSAEGAEVALTVGALVGLVVGAVVGLVVGAAVGLVVGADVAALEGLVVGEAVAGAVVGFVVGVVDGLEVGALVASDPPYTRPVSTTVSGTMLFICTVIWEPEEEVKRRVTG